MLLILVSRWGFSSAASRLCVLDSRIRYDTLWTLYSPGLYQHAPK